MKPILILSVIVLLLGITYTSHLSHIQFASDHHNGYGLVVSTSCETSVCDDVVKTREVISSGPSLQKTQETDTSDNLRTQLSGKHFAIGFSIL